MGKNITLADVIILIQSEHDHAEATHPNFPPNPIHGAAVLSEHSGKVSEAALHRDYEQERYYPGRIKKEALEAAVVAIRIIQSLPLDELK